MPKNKGRKKIVKKFEALGILNQFGDFWTHQTFDTEYEARKYMKDFWIGIPNPPSMNLHRIVPVKGTITYTLPKKSAKHIIK